MYLSKLTKEQKLQLKSNILVENFDKVSYGDIANVDEIISDELLEERYGGTYFVEEDFVS